MRFTIEKSIEILERTPSVLNALLQNISDFWTANNEGADTWSPYDIVGHLIEGEKNDWIQRMEIILSDNPDKNFKSFNRLAQFEESKGKSLRQLLMEFEQLRKVNIEYLKTKNISAKNLEQMGKHPAFGEVKLSRLLASWVVHDLNHISQITRVMAKQYKDEVGPWIEYLRILK